MNMKNFYQDDKSNLNKILFIYFSYLAYLQWLVRFPWCFFLHFILTLWTYQKITNEQLKQIIHYCYPTESVPPPPPQ